MNKDNFEFQVGDEVEWAGANGIVVDSKSGIVDVQLVDANAVF